MRIEKRGKHYRVQVQVKGIRYSFTFTYKPSRREVYDRLDKEASTADVGTVYDYIYKYIELKSNILSPATIRGYRNIIKHLQSYFGNMQLYKLDQVELQKYVNVYALNHSPKSVINMFSLISVVLRTFRPGFIFHVTLPRIIKKEPYIPTLQDIKLILKESYNSKYFSSIILAIFGLRRSEIVALTLDDFKDNYVCINKAIVRNKKNALVQKSTKTYTDRIVYMPPQLIDLIREKGLYSGSPDGISNYMYRLVKKLKLKNFSIHKLRHFYASICHYFNMPDIYIQKQGGWANDSVMKSVYTHALERERVQITQNINYKIMENLFDSAPQMHQETIEIKKSPNNKDF